MTQKQSLHHYIGVKGTMLNSFETTKTSRILPPSTPKPYLPDKIINKKPLGDTIIHPCCIVPFQ